MLPFFVHNYVHPNQKASEITSEAISSSLTRAWHSLSQVGLGESDLAFKIKTQNEEIIFLLENKIDADFQPNKAGRYKLH